MCGQLLIDQVFFLHSPILSYNVLDLQSSLHIMVFHHFPLRYCLSMTGTTYIFTTLLFLLKVISQIPLVEKVNDQLFFFTYFVFYDHNPMG